MFGVDATQISLIEAESPRYQVRQQLDSFEYLFPKFLHQSPWQPTDSHNNTSLVEDFILIAEFSEQEGPRPVIVIPKDGGKNFDQNEFSVKILAVDHQSSIVEGFETTEDAQVVMSDPDTDTHAFIHHIVLNDIQARGYVRLFCISYVTPDPQKVMKCYEEISSQMKKVARLMKYGNRLVFMRDLEKFQEDLSYTKTQLLISQSRTQATSQGDNDLLNALNTLRQCMEEVKDIIASLKPLIQDDTELSERFQCYERELKCRARSQSKEDSDISSLLDQGLKDSGVKEFSGSYTERTSPEFSLFSKIKDQKPKILDVSAIRGKRRFDRSLRGLHELCSWGAKEGLQRLRGFREFLKRDLASIYIDEMDMSAFDPEKGVLCFGSNSGNTVGANFLSTSGSIRNVCCVKRKMSEMCYHHPGLSSLGSVDSFQSLPSSFQSFYEDEPMFSAQSSMADTSAGRFYERQTSQLSSEYSVPSERSQEDTEFMFQNDNFTDANSCLDLSMKGSYSPLLDTLDTLKGANVDVEGVLDANANMSQNLEHIPKADQDSVTLQNEGRNSSQRSLTDSSKGGSSSSELKVENDSRKRGGSTNSDFENIEIEKDLKCNAKGCKCGKAVVVSHKTDIMCNTKNGGARNTSPCDEKLLVKNVSCNSVVDEFNKEVCNFNKLEMEIEVISQTNGGDVDIISNSVMTDSTCTLCDNSSVIKGEGSDLLEANIVKEHKDSELTVHNAENYHNFDDDKENLEVRSIADNTEEVDDCVPGKLASVVNQHFKKDDSGEVPGKVITDSCVTENFDVNFQDGLGENLDDFEGDVGKVSQFSGSEESGVDIGPANDKQSVSSDNSAGLGLRRDSSAEFRQSVGSDNSAGLGLRRDSSAEFMGSVCVGGHLHKYTDMQTRKRRLKFMHPLRNVALSEGECSLGQALQKMFSSYNNLPHIVYSLLSGRPVVVIGNRKHEGIIKEFVQALSMFVPYTPRPSSVTLLCPRKQLKISEVQKFQLLGLIRSDKQSVDYLLPKSLRRYITVVDVEKMLICCQPYQGTLLGFISSIHSKKKTFKSDVSLITFIQLCLEEISTKAFSFYHSISSADGYSVFSGTSLPRKSAMLELSSEKYLNKAGVMNADCRIIKHLSEIVILQQIEEEYTSKNLTDASAYPFTVAYQPLQTFKL